MKVLEDGYRLAVGKDIISQVCNNLIRENLKQSHLCDNLRVNFDNGTLL
jgi:hypothetical protein